MNSLLIAGIVFGGAFGGALLGMFLRLRLPERHFSKQSRDVVLLATGLIGSMAALVLGLLIAAAFADYAAENAGFQQLAANLVLLDRALDRYGPEARPARVALKLGVAQVVQQLWPENGERSPHAFDSPQALGPSHLLADAILNLTPQTEAQKAVQAQAISIVTELAKIRWQLTLQDNNSIPRAFLVVLVFWISILFLSFGLYAPHNLTVVIVLLVCALSVAAAVLLIVDLDQPFEGLIQSSGRPLKKALMVLGQ